VQYDAKLQQLQNRVFDISRHDHLPQYSALSPPDEKLSTHLIRSKHVILSGFHGAHAYNDNILGDIIREEVDAALKLIGYHDAIALWRHISTELSPTSDSYQSGVKVNWNAGIRIIPQLSTFSVLLELQQPIWAHNHGITDIDILPLTGILYSQSNITKTKFPENRRGQYQQKPSIRQYRFQFLSDTISHISHLCSDQTKTICSFRSVCEEPPSQVSHTIFSLAQKLVETSPLFKHGQDYFLLHDRILHTRKVKTHIRRDFETVIRLVINNPTASIHVANTIQKELEKFIWKASKIMKTHEKISEKASTS
jgi:hypothetical protein